jgi:hypothetical protein
MSFISIDYIASKWLVDRRYPKHWYVDAIGYISNWLRESQLHSLPMIESHTITLNSYKAGPLPCGYLSWVRVGIKDGQFIKPIAGRQGLINTVNTDENGNKVPHGTSEITEEEGYRMYWLENLGTYGEDLGRQYGGSGDDTGLFKIMKERNEIQMVETYTEDTVYMDCLVSLNNAKFFSKIDEMCLPAAKSFADWQHERNRKTRNETVVREAEARYREHMRILRANMFDYGMADIINIWYQSVKGSPK